MKTITISKSLARAMSLMSIKVAECNEYGWSDEFCRKEIKEAQQTACDILKHAIDWDNLTDEDCDLLGFGKWAEENPLRLIPIFLKPLIPSELELTSISDKKVKGKDIDNDHRFGYLAYGVIPKNVDTTHLYMG